jgi:VCBS repeat-containing protein
LDAINTGTTLPAVDLTATDSDSATANDSATPSYNAENDGPSIDVVAEATIDDVNTNTVVATFTANDEEDGTPVVDFTENSNTDGYYVINGTDVQLTQAGVDFINGGGTLPVVNLTATDTGGLTVSDSAIPDTVPIAVDDTNSVLESMNLADQVAKGNVVTGVTESTSEIAGKDTVGADANATPVTAFNGAMEYGTLDLDADGSYSYTLDSKNIKVTALQNNDTLTDEYEYTITDGDGSTATATLSIVINGADGAPILHGMCMRGDTRADDLTALNVGETRTESKGGTETGGTGDNDRLIIDFSEHTSTTNGDSTIGSTATFSATSFGTVAHQGFEHFTIKAANGVTTLTTGAGEDIIINNGIGANNLTLGAGNNRIETGGGVNTIDFTSGNNTIKTGDGANTITGTSGHNYIDTGAGVDTITVGIGDNIIKSGDGASTIIAGDGNNFVCSGVGADTITLGHGDNVVLAGDGANTVVAGGGKNFIIGGGALDTLTAGDGGNYIDGGPAGANTIVSGGGNDTIFGGIGADTISAGGGDDRIHILGVGANTVHGEGGSDTLIVDFSDATAAITNTTPAGAFAAGYTGTIGGSGATSYTGIETFDITTGSGNDIIMTGDGDDILFGSVGDDALSAGAGDDVLTGGEGINTLTGGSGSDIFIVNGANSKDTITDFSLSEGDVLNFADFLDYDDDANTDLTSYLNVSFDNSNNSSTITANSAGNIGGTASESGDTLSVVIRDANFMDLGGNQGDILQNLINDNHLIVDQM